MNTRNGILLGLGGLYLGGFVVAMILSGIVALLLPVGFAAGWVFGMAEGDES